MMPKLTLPTSILITGGLLAISLVISANLNSPDNESVEAKNKIMALSEANPISPSRALKEAFDESSQHSAMADIAELACLPSSRYDCGLDGCTPTEPASYYFVDYGTESGTYFRCDTKGCDPYPVNVVHSGSFTQFIPALGQAMFLKVSTDESLGNKGQFIDIATLGTGAIMSFGTCVFK